MLPHRVGPAGVARHRPPTPPWGRRHVGVDALLRRRRRRRGVRAPRGTPCDPGHGADHHQHREAGRVGVEERGDGEEPGDRPQDDQHSAAREPRAAHSPRSTSVTRPKTNERGSAIDGAPGGAGSNHGLTRSRTPSCANSTAATRTVWLHTMSTSLVGEPSSPRSSHDRVGGVPWSAVVGYGVTRCVRRFLRVHLSDESTRRSSSSTRRSQRCTDHRTRTSHTSRSVATAVPRAITSGVAGRPATTSEQGRLLHVTRPPPDRHRRPAHTPSLHVTCDSTSEWRGPRYVPRGGNPVRGIAHPVPIPAPARGGSSCRWPR